MKYLDAYLLTAILAFCAIAQETRPSPTSHPVSAADLDKMADELSEEISAATDGITITERYHELWKKAGEEGLQRLKLDRDDGIAIQSAWREVSLSPRHEDKKARAMRPDRHKLDWFLGFVEGRVRVRVPKWWREAILDAQEDNHNEIMACNKFISGLSKMSLYHNAGLDRARAPIGTTLAREGDKIILQVGKDVVQIPEDLLQKTDDGKVWCRVSALMKTDQCYVAAHDDWGYPFKLACISRRSGKVLWKSDVLGTWWLNATGGSEMWVSVIEQDKRVIVFGSSSTGLHVEAFRADNGATVFRFSTSYEMNLE